MLAGRCPGDTQAVRSAFKSPPWSRRAAPLPDAVAVLARGHSAQEQSILKSIIWPDPISASLAQLVEHALRKRMIVGSIPTGGSIAALTPAFHVSQVSRHTAD